VRLHAVAQEPAVNVVEVRHASMIFGSGESRHAVFEDISFEAAAGSFLCIVGSAGCGKTTLLRQIAGCKSRPRARSCSTASWRPAQPRTTDLRRPVARIQRDLLTL
jgi:ABC-type nitrate/sulfonate/bicarbonate transport system ATPase subunit